MSTVQVEYIGTKPVKEDNVAGTGVVWAGQGDVQTVPMSAWAALAKHPGIWRLVGDEGQAPAAATAVARAVGRVIGHPNEQKPLAAAVEADKPTGEHEFDPAQQVEIAPGVVTTLGELHEEARKASGLTPEEWAEMQVGDRQDFVDDFVGQLQQKAADKKVDEIDPAEAAKRLEASRQEQAASAEAKAREAHAALLAEAKNLGITGVDGRTSAAKLQAAIEAKKAGK